MPNQRPRDRSGLRAAIGLFLLAPWMAEFAWGGLGIADMLAAVLFLGPLYGAAAILIREIARRSGRGWPAILLLALAFGIFQAGVVDQSLFNPEYGDYHFQHPAHIGGIDLSAYWLLNFTVGHVIASIGTPVALVETFAHRKTLQPWLGRRGLVFTSLLYVLGTVLNYLDLRQTEDFQARPSQTALALGVALLLVVLALRLPIGDRADHRPAPSPVLLAALAFVVYLIWLPFESWWGVVVAIPVLAAASTAILRWSRRTGWSSAHVFALAAGVVLTNLYTPFATDPYEDLSRIEERVSDVTAAVISLLLVVAGWYWLPRSPDDRGGRRRKGRRETPAMA